jgi:F-type H+-transporting ATPase subunit a
MKNERMMKDKMSEAAAEHGHGPLSQFEVHLIVPFKVGEFDLSFTNASLWMLIAVVAITIFMYLGLRNRQLVPGRWQSLSEILVQFVRNTVHDIAGPEALKYFPFIFSLFMFLLFANLVGMVPYSFTVTSHIIVTFAMAIGIFLFCTLLAIVKHGPMKFAHFFLPHGTPLWLAPLMIPIEIFSYLTRPVSLSVRLAANMMAGHTMLKVIAGFVVMMGLLGGWLPLAFLVALTAFEVGIAMLQAYVFTVLTCVYLNDALHLH